MTVSSQKSRDPRYLRLATNAYPVSAAGDDEFDASAPWLPPTVWSLTAATGGRCYGMPYPLPSDRPVLRRPFSSSVPRSPNAPYPRSLRAALCEKYGRVPIQKSTAKRP